MGWKSSKPAEKLLSPVRNFDGGGSPEGAEVQTCTLFSPPLGALWLLSGAPESNNFASAEATGAAKENSLVFNPIKPK